MKQTLRLTLMITLYNCCVNIVDEMANDNTRKQISHLLSFRNFILYSTFFFSKFRELLDIWWKPILGLPISLMVNWQKIAKFVKHIGRPNIDRPNIGFHQLCDNSPNFDKKWYKVYISWKITNVRFVFWYCHLLFHQQCLYSNYTK